MKSLKMNWGIGIALVYAAFALATTGFAVFAMDQRVDLVSSDYYERALSHDRRMAAEANGADPASGLNVEIDDAGRLVTLTWAAALPSRGTALLYRAADERLDRTVALGPDASGHQRISLDGMPAGRWTLQLQWQAGGREFYLERTVTAR